MPGTLTSILAGKADLVDGKIKTDQLPTATASNDGKSAYDIAVDNGYTGTVQEWLLSLNGEDGVTGTPGSNGQDGYTPIKGVDYFDGVKGDKGDRGDQGLQGIPGEDGSDADVSAHESTFVHLNIHALGSDNQDLSGLQPKETGKGLSTNDYTTVDKDKLTALPIIKVSATEPQNPQVNDIWIDIS